MPDILIPSREVVWTPKVRRTRRDCYVIDPATGYIHPNQQPPTTLGLARAANPYGKCFRSGTTSQVNSYPIPTTTLGTGDFTLALDVTPENLSGSTYAYATGSNISYFALALRHSLISDNAGLLLPGLVWINSGMSASALSLACERYKIVVIRRNGNTYFNINGQVTRGTNSTNISDPITALALNSYTTSGGLGTASGNYNLLAFEPRAWTEAEAREFIDDPHSVYVPETLFIGFDASGGGGATAVTSDFADSYVIRAAVSQDFADSYAIRAAVATELADSYGVLSAVATNLADAYSINAAVNADLSDSYLLRVTVARDLADSYGVRAAVASNLADSYDIANADVVVSDLADAYLIRATIASDMTDSAAIRAAVMAEIEDAYAIRAAASNDLADGYTVINAVSADLIDAHAIRAAVAADLLDAYSVFSGSGTGATVEEIVAAILAAAQANPIHANIQKINDVEVVGAGVPGDEWGAP